MPILYMKQSEAGIPQPHHTTLSESPRSPIPNPHLLDTMFMHRPVRDVICNESVAFRQAGKKRKKGHSGIRH